MDKNKKDIIEIVLLGAILVVLVLILAMTGIKTKMVNDNKFDSNDNLFGEISDNNDSDKESESDNSNNQIDNVQNNNSSNDVEIDNDSNNEIKPTDKDSNTSNVINNTNNNDNNNSNVNNSQNSSDSNVINESVVVTYLSNLESKLDTYNNENDKTFREKAKDIFVTTVDFLFYDGVIKGYTFDELSLSTKLKVLKIIASIDNKIDKYFPNYKDMIKEKATNFKGKIAVLYLETTSKLCDKVGEDSCNEARNDFNNMKTNFGYTWSILKEVLTTSKDKLSVVLSEWYKSIK